jgi:hypothetical protein
MKIEFNGRAVVSFCLGLLVGGIAMGVGLALGPIGRIQRERDDARTQGTIAEARANRIKGSAQGFAQQWINTLKASGQTGSAGGCIDQWDPSSCFNVSFGNGLPAALLATVPASQAPQSQDPAVQVLNMVRPGLGTVVGALANAAQKAQAAKAAADQQAMMQALQREQTEKHCPSGNCAACPDGWKLFSNPQETYCVPASEN